MLRYACATLCLLATGVANATVDCTKDNQKRLKFFSFDTAEIVWQTNRIDSPLDSSSNNQRIIIHVLRQDLIDPYDYAGAYNDCTGIEGRTVEQVRNLSFDFINTASQPVHIGAGSPRISVELDTNGDKATDLIAYLAAFYCQEALSGEWSRADFTGRVSTGCTFYDWNSVSYSSDGVKSAWAVFAAAHPGAKVIDAYLVADEDAYDPATGRSGATSILDRLAFHNKQFRASGTGSAAIQNCPTEASC
jgi:hypothetical protein